MILPKIHLYGCEIVKEFKIEAIGHIENDFKEKFGIPRQSGMVNSLISKIVFEKKYQDADAFRGIEGYSHLWILWIFSENADKGWSPTVRPPKLGGNIRRGVFATRSPFRPNTIGLSAVELVKFDLDACGKPVLYVKGADLMNNTPIIDIKPYIPYADCISGASGGFSVPKSEDKLSVSFDSGIIDIIPSEKQEPLVEILSHNPAPAYQDDSGRIYRMRYGEFEVSFKTDGEALEVTNIKHIGE